MTDHPTHFRFPDFCFSIMLKFMSDPINRDEDGPPSEELEMAAEEVTGKPFAGHPAERIAALTKRIAYLQKQLRALGGTEAQTSGAAGKVAQDLAEARRQLAQWQAQAPLN